MASPTWRVVALPPMSERVAAFTAKAAALLNHINLLRVVYANRDLLGNETVEAYMNWVRLLVRPWIESDEELKQTWRTFRNSADLSGGEFVKWLSQHLAIL